MIKRTLFVVLVLLVSYFIVFLFGDTFAYSYDIDNSLLFYKNNRDELESDIKKYISSVDDYIVPNSSFLMCDYLDCNYDFLVYFAMDYVTGNYEYYIDRVISGNSYSYLDRDMNQDTTNLYVLKSDLYNITDKYFGVRDFYIINDNVKLEDDYVSLIDYTSRRFDLSIIDVDVVSNDFDVSASVLYENDVKYLYTFKNIDGVLKIKNIEVL